MRKILLAALLSCCAAGAQNIYVDDNAAPGGTGSASSPFQTIGDAVNQANGSPFISTIWVAPGDYTVNSTISVQKAMILRGSTVLVQDAYGPTGVIQSGTTRVIGTGALGSAPLLSVAKTGAVISSMEIRGFVFETDSAIGGLVELKRVQGMNVHDNLFRGTTNLARSAPAISTYAATGLVQNNYATGLLGGAFVSAGYALSPASVVVRNNRFISNQNGILLVGTSDGIPEPGDTLTATVMSNDLSSNAVNSASAGLRMMIKGNEALASTNLSKGAITASVVSNRITNNSIGIVLDAGFPYRVIPPANTQCDTRTFRGNITASFAGNTLTGNAAPPMIAFAREQMILGLTPLSRWQYLHNSNFILSDANNTFASANIYKPPTDPFTGGPCANDVTNEPLNNTLLVNGMIK